MAKDLDPRVDGRRLRVAFTRYNPGRKYFETIKNSAFVVTVVDAAEQKRMISAIEEVISEGAWKNDRVDGVRDAADRAAAPV